MKVIKCLGIAAKELSHKGAGECYSTEYTGANSKSISAGQRSQIWDPKTSWSFSILNDTSKQQLDCSNYQVHSKKKWNRLQSYMSAKKCSHLLYLATYDDITPMKLIRQRVHHSEFLFLPWVIHPTCDIPLPQEPTVCPVSRQLAMQKQAEPPQCFPALIGNRVVDIFRGRNKRFHSGAQG